LVYAVVFLNVVGFFFQKNLLLLGRSWVRWIYFIWASYVKCTSMLKRV
jgi:hypothetical protein